MQLRYSRALLPSVTLLILSLVVVPVQAIAAEQADEKAVTTGEAETSTVEVTPSTWDKTREVSGDAWDATKEGSAKAWKMTKEVSSDAWDATKEGSAKAWEKTRKLAQPDAEAGATPETTQP